MPSRTLRPRQRAELYVVDVVTGESSLVTSSSTLLFEAPNWTPDGQSLVVNGDGLLFVVPVGGGDPVPVPLGDMPPINNDHVLSPDGTTVYVSADDGHVYAVPFATGEARRVSNDRGPTFHHYLHGVSPDGELLAYIGLLQNDDGSATTNVYTIPTAGGSGRRGGPASLIETDGRVHDVVHLFGGQGTMNVASWAQDSRRFACGDLAPVDLVRVGQRLRDADLGSRRVEQFAPGVDRRLDVLDHDGDLDQTCE